MQVTILEQIYRTDPAVKKERENFYISKVQRVKENNLRLLIAIVFFKTTTIFHFGLEQV